MVIDPAKTYTAEIDTSEGTITIDLDAKNAPLTVNNFVCLSEAAYYNFTPFHRIIKDFMIQAGDPTGTGVGGPGYQFADELPTGTQMYTKGTIAMANAGPGTNGSQFFIVQKDQPVEFPANYPIFGHVSSGIEVVDTIASVPVQANVSGETSDPVVQMVIVSVKIFENGQENVGINYATDQSAPTLDVGGTAKIVMVTWLRGGPAATAVERSELKEGTMVTITDEPVRSGGFVWWPVIVSDTGDQGWVEASSLVPLISATDEVQTPEELAALLPEADAAPAGLDAAVDTELDQAGVVEALGGGRPAEQNLETWGWTGNAQRVFSPSDPEALEPDATTFLSASVHGFATPAAAAEALPFFSDILVDGGWEEVEAPDLGDAARMLQTVNEDGSTNVALYIQEGTVLYRIGGSSTGGDPTQDVTEMATSILDA